MFGGATGIGQFISNHLDTIWYIDMATSPPETPSTPPPAPAFNCSQMSNGSYPHPSNCSSFFICRDEMDVGVFTCPQPLLYDAVRQTCNSPQHVQCFLTCKDKDGLYSHPKDNKKFILCTLGMSKVEGYDCPGPLVFHPERLVCDLPDYMKSHEM
jgi:hypothetical protein